MPLDETNSIRGKNLDILHKSPKCVVNPQPNTQGIGLLVGKTSRNRCSPMHVFPRNFEYNLQFLCPYIFIRVILSDREIYPLLLCPNTCRFLISQLTTKIQAQVSGLPL